MYFRGNLENNDQVYTAHARLVEGSNLLEWDIQMNGIPIEVNGVSTGMEVIAKWELVGADNQDIFYTDSNGLEMQKRVLNQRPDFDLVTDMQVSSNYYPINSAIALRDTKTNMQMTVMNDRSQGGAVIKNGAIELMQNRRLLFDDNRGVEEPLNETDSQGRGIEVNAKYFVQIFDTQKTPSLQRQTQLIVDEPIQYMFAKKFTSDDNSCLSCYSQWASPIQEAVQAQTSQFDGELKVHAFPQSKSQILVRLENIADLFDGAPAQVPYFNLKQYATQLYALANAGTQPTGVTITERTLGNN